MQKLLPAPQRDPAGAAGLQDPGQSRTSQPQPRQHRQGSGACSAQRPQQHLLPLDILHTAPPWDHLCQGKGFSKPVLQDFFSGAAGLAVQVKQLGYSLPSPAGSTFPAEPCDNLGDWVVDQGASSFPPCLCRLDTHTTVTTASLRRDIPFSAFKFNSPSKAGSSDELTAAEQGTFFCLLGL